MVPLLNLMVLAVVGLVVWRMGMWPETGVLAGVAGGLVVTAVLAAREARTAAGFAHSVAEEARTADQAAALSALAVAEKTLLWSTDQLCGGTRPPVPDVAEPQSAGPAARVEAAVHALKAQIVVSLARVHDESATDVLLDVLHRLAMRELVLVDKALARLTGLEMATDDPEWLDPLWRIDHLMARLRRHVESTAVLGGASLRTSRQPLSVMTVLRGASSEVVQFARVSTVTGAADIGLAGHVGPDVMHVLAELIENACENSDPATRVTVRAQQVQAGLAIEVEDRGVGMRPEVRAQMNGLLATPDDVDVSDQVRAGRIGLLTAAKIAQRHEVFVQLQENPMGGTTALVVVPARVLVTMAPVSKASAQRTGPHPVVSPPAQSRPVQPAAGPAREEQSQRDGEPQLPRRPHTHGALRATAPQQPAPMPAATPGMAADFLAGSRKGSTAASTPEPSEP
ncbi:ATP-binding protein [Streptomyces sp. NPDC038707]|uniref:sensor histidine kinase n=1 Tax=Streptomyces sp. NPDC038707 TaxID=3154329 RepID=UPI0033FDB79C